MSNQGHSVWRDEKLIDELKKLWAEGLSASQIAMRLGHGLTRNACIAKLHRLGLMGRGSPKSRIATKSRKPVARTAPRRPPPTPAQKQAQTTIWGKTSPVPVEVEPYVATPEPKDYIPRQGEKVTIVRKNANGDIEENPLLSSSVCRWPIGDPMLPDFHFCGHGKVEGLPYCAYHAQRAYQPPLAKRSRQNGVAANRAGSQTESPEVEKV